MNKKDFIRIDSKCQNDLIADQAQINVFIVGLRGYTQNYGGWESFAHGLIDNWTDEKVHFFAFEKVDTLENEGYYRTKNVTCIRICEKSKKSSSMMKYDRNCTNFSLFLQKKYCFKNPILFFLGVRIGPYVWFKKRTIKRNGFMIVENPAGVEWKRTKWNKMVQFYLYVSALMMARSVDCMVCDNEGIVDVYRNMNLGKKPLLTFVPYGVDTEYYEKNSQDESTVLAGKEFLKSWGLKENEYFLILGRFVPENNYEMMINAFMKSNTRKKLLIITNYKTELPKFFKHICKTTNYQNDDRIIMAGTLYDKKALCYIRTNAVAYIHGHSVGGTNPGLLEALASTDVNFLYNAPFNKFVGMDCAYYFGNEKELTALIDNVDGINLKNKKELGMFAKKRMKSVYSWQRVVDDYDKVFMNLITND